MSSTPQEQAKAHFQRVLEMIESREDIIKATRAELTATKDELKATKDELKATKEQLAQEAKDKNALARFVNKKSHDAAKENPDANAILKAARARTSADKLTKN